MLRPGGLFFVHAFCGDDDDLRRQPFCDWVDPRTRLHVIDGVPRRYVARPDELLSEIRDVGLEVLHHQIVRIPGAMMHCYCTKA